MKRRTYYVNSTHILPEYCFKHEVITVVYDESECFADHYRLGCGKTRDTAFEAIFDICYSNGMTNVSIVGASDIVSL
jgi:hypothetical protein